MNESRSSDENAKGESNDALDLTKHISANKSENNEWDMLGIGSQNKLINLKQNDLDDGYLDRSISPPNDDFNYETTRNQEKNETNDRKDRKHKSATGLKVNTTNPFAPNYQPSETVSKTPHQSKNKMLNDLVSDMAGQGPKSSRSPEKLQKGKYKTEKMRSPRIRETPQDLKIVNKSLAKSTKSHQVSPRSVVTSQANASQSRSRVIPFNRSQKLQKGEETHKSILERRETRKWGKGGGNKGNLSYDKLLAAINLKHPRQINDEQEPEPIPLCVSTGSLLTCGDNEQKDGIDNLGIAVSIYFKLLKSLVIFFIICSIVCSPLYFFYSCGNVSRQASSTLQEYLSEWTLGNIGESSYQCKQRNLKIYDSIELWCPAGSRITSLEKFGLQKVGAKVEENQCPQTIDNFQTLDSLLVELDDRCNLEGLETFNKEYYTTIMNQFNTRCLGNTSCDMFVRNMDWPDECAQKIGVRLEMIIISETKYKNVTELIEVQSIIQPQVQMATIDKADLEEVMILNDVIGYHDEGEEINQDLLNRNITEIENSTSTFTPNYYSSTDTKEDSASKLGSQNQTLVYPPKCDPPSLTTDCLPPCTSILGENTECYPLCTDNMDPTVECSKSNTPLNPLPNENEVPKVVVYIQPPSITKISYVNQSRVASYIEYQEAFEYVIDQSQEGFFLYVIFECSNEMVNLRFPYEGQDIERRDLGIMTVIIDIIIMSIFIITIWFISYLVKKDSERHKNLLFETKEFAIAVRNLPVLNCLYSIEQMKAELWDHFSVILKQENRQIQQLSSSEERSCEIIDIQFAMSDYQFLDDIVQIKEISKVIEKIEMQIEEIQDDDVKRKEQQGLKEQYLEQIERLKQNYFDNLEQMGEDNQAIQAFVLFRSMEGVERALNAFNYSRLQIAFFSVFSCCMSQRQHNKLFKRHWLIVERGLEPELLIWENFGVTSNSRRVRLVFYFIFTVAMLIACFYMILGLEQASNSAENEVPDIQCPDSVDPKAANIDYYADLQVRVGDFHCFCKNLFSSQGLQAAQDFKFPLDDKSHCNEWFEHYTTIIATIIGIAILIILGNVAVEVLIGYGAQFTRPVNQQQIIVSSIRAISWIQFINLGLILFVINMSLKLGKSENPKGILQGNYSDFSSMWYIDVGTQIIFAMILEISAPHLIPLLQLIYLGSARLYDRSCSCDKRKSKKFLQSEYENLYIGPEFSLDARLAQIIAFTWVTFMYSAGLPSLFLITAFNFFVIYWIDKWLLLRFYRTPKNYDEVCINFSLTEMKLSIPFHFIIGAVVYSNEKILTSKGVGSSLVESITSEGEIQESIFSLQRYNSVHCILFIVANLIFVIIIFFEQTFISFFSKYLCCCLNFERQFEKMQALSDDYYDQMHFKFLISEYERAKLEKQKFTLYIDRIKGEPDFFERQGFLNKHIKRLKHKEQQILLKVDELCELIGVNEPTIQQKVSQLQINILKINAKKEYMIKSKIQTYDIRDCEEYYGILELETLLKRLNKENPYGQSFSNSMDFQNEIRRSSSKIYVPGSILNRMSRKKKGTRVQPGGSPSKAIDLEPVSESDGSILSESELDEILMNSQIDPSLLDGPKKNERSSKSQNHSINIQGYSKNAKTVEFGNKSRKELFTGYQTPATAKPQKNKFVNILGIGSEQKQSKVGSFTPNLQNNKGLYIQRERQESEYERRPSYFYKKGA